MRLIERLRKIGSPISQLRQGTAPPSVSVVINTYNRRDHLERTLVALRDQTYPRYEVVVVNGPSTDDTADMLDRFKDSARLATCEHASLGRSRNIGVAAAAGDIVAFTDDDAIPRPDWLEMLVAPYNDKTVAAVGGPVFDVPLDRIDWKLCTCNRLGISDTDSGGPIDSYLGRGADPFVFLAGCNMSFRRKALQAIGGFNSFLAYGYDDVDVCCRLIDAGQRVAYVNDALVRHDRASNAVRDDRNVIRDPYSIIHSRAVFSMHCAPSPHSQDEIVEIMTSWARDWRNVADQYLNDGQLTADEHQRFVERAVSGAMAGTAEGAMARPWTHIPEPPRHLFRPYRRRTVGPSDADSAVG